MTDRNEPPEATLGTYLAVLRRRKWWVISFTVLGLVISLGYSLTAAQGVLGHGTTPGGTGNWVGYRTVRPNSRSPRPMCSPSSSW